jgi:conjugative transfer signal peptidase TraF
MSRLVARAVIAGLGLAFLATAALLAGARVNTSKSIPLGLYWTSRAPVQKGAYVMVCPPPFGVFVEAKKRDYIGSGFCPGGFGYMMKKILAAKTDLVVIDADGVQVNGVLLPFSVPRIADTAGRPLPRYPVPSFTLGQDDVLLMSDVSATSWDARYYGPVKLAQIATVITPIFTW